MKRSIHFLLPALFAAPVHAQIITAPSSTPGFGQEVAILNDADGGGKREILVSSPGSGLTGVASGYINVMSPETGTSLVTIFPFPSGVPISGAQFGRSLASLGDIDAFPNDEFVVATPNMNTSTGLRGEVTIFSLRFVSSQWQAVYVRSLYSSIGVINDSTFGTSVVVLTGQATASGRAIAVGIPNLNKVEIFDPSTGAKLRTLDVGTVTGSIGGGLGFSLAVGPGNVLAAGAPDYRPPGAPSNQFRYGYVAIYDLNSASVFPRSFLYRGNPSEAIGRAMASVGQLPGNPASTLSDFAVLGGGSLGVPPQVYLFHSPSFVMTGPTPTAFIATLQVFAPAAPNDGRMATMNDIDGDGIGDVAVTSGGSFNVLSTAGNVLTAVINPLGASTSAGLASGPDLLNIGATDVVLGTPSLSGGTVWVVPLATNVRLPNPPGVSLDVSVRPVVGVTYPMTATGTPGTAIGVLVNLAPFTPIPFGGGPSLQYLDNNGAVTVGFGTSPLSTSAAIPSSPSNVGQAFLFQAVQFNANGSLTLSNGIMARLGLF